MDKEVSSDVNDIGPLIQTIRGQKVILDSDLARIFGVPTFRFNEAIKRNRTRFPSDFMFQLTAGEAKSLRSQFAILKKGRGRHRKFLPYAFTENGAVMAANGLNRARRKVQSQRKEINVSITSHIATVEADPTKAYNQDGADSSGSMRCG